MKNTLPIVMAAVQQLLLLRGDEEHPFDRHGAALLTTLRQHFLILESSIVYRIVSDTTLGKESLFTQ